MGSEVGVWGEWRSRSRSRSRSRRTEEEEDRGGGGQRRRRTEAEERARLTTEGFSAYANLLLDFEQSISIHHKGRKLISNPPSCSPQQHATQACNNVACKHWQAEEA